MKLITMLLVLVGTSLQAQENYYVSVSSLNLRSSASSDSEIVSKLSKHDNLNLISIDGDWAKVEKGEKTGYVFKEYIKKGKALVSYTSVRTGATCKDGTSSNATGRGACSHHGGVRNWKTRQQKSVRILNH